MREIGALRSLWPLRSVCTAEGITAKFTDRAAHGIMPTQGCSQTHSQRLVELPSSNDCSFAASPPIRIEAGAIVCVVPACGVNNASALADSGAPGEHRSGARLEGHARDPGSRRHRHMVHTLGTNHQPILNHAARDGGHNTLSRPAQSRPAAPSQSIPAPNTN